MDTSIGSAVNTTVSLSSFNDTSAHNYYYTKFVSPLIYQTSISANTWVYAFAAREAVNATANFPVNGNNAPVWVNIYVWQPSNGTKVGTILDGNTASTVDEGAINTTVYHIVNCTGSAVAGLTSGDAVIIIEVWFKVTATAAAVTQQRIEFDGGTVSAENATNTDAASYLETPETLALSPPPTGGGPVARAFNLSKYITMDLSPEIRLGPGNLGGINMSLPALRPRPLRRRIRRPRVKVQYTYP